jgi:hypothetical protein
MKKALSCFPEKSKSLLTKVLLVFIIALFVISCGKLQDNFDFSKVVVPDWNPEFAIPLINSTYALQDFFDDSTIEYVQTNPDNSLSLVYTSDQIYSPRFEDIIIIPDQLFNYQSSFSAPPTPPGLSFEIMLEFPISIGAGSPDQRLDSLFLKSGFLQLAGQTNLNRDFTELTVKIPEIIHNVTGEALVMVVSLNNPGGQQTNVSYDLSVPIGEYKFIFDNTSTSTKNTINLECTLKILGDNNPDLSPYNYSITGSFSDLEFKSLFGYIGTNNFSIADSLPISLFSKTIGGGIEVGPDAIDLIVDVENSIGMPVTIGTEYFYAYSPVNVPNIVDIYFNGAGVPNLFTIQSPDITQVGETVETHIDFENNNFNEAFNIAPEELYYKFVGSTNIEGDSLSSNFVIDTSRISMQLAVEFQIFAAISTFIIQDTIEFDFDENVEEVDHLLFRINATNGFPIDASVQIYFADKYYNVIDSLITDPDQSIISGAPVNGPPDYRVSAPAHKMTDINLTSERIQNILDAENMILRAGISTTNEQLVKIYSDYALQIQVGTIAAIKLENN